MKIKPSPHRLTPGTTATDPYKSSQGAGPRVRTGWRFFLLLLGLGSCVWGLGCSALRTPHSALPAAPSARPQTPGANLPPLPPGFTASRVSGIGPRVSGLGSGPRRQSLAPIPQAEPIGFTLNAAVILINQFGWKEWRFTRQESWEEWMLERIDGTNWVSMGVHREPAGAGLSNTLIITEAMPVPETRTYCVIRIK